MNTTFLRSALIALVLVVVAPTALATQHLVQPGDDVAALVGKVQPGDEIVLMPGEHGEIDVKGLVGTAEQPVVIRGLDNKTPGPIRAKYYGLHLRACRYVEVRDIFIFGARDAGVLIDSPRADVVDDGDIVLRRVSVVRTGDMVGDHDAIRVHGVANVVIEDCRIEGWTTSAIDIVACRHLVVERCQLTKRQGYPTISGITIRAGSQDVRVSSTRFDSAGVVAVTCGGTSANDDFRPHAKNDMPAGTLTEASDVLIERNVFIMGHTPVAFVNARDCRFRSNTIPYAKETVIAAIRQTRDPRYAPSRDITFSRNLIAWTPGELRSLAKWDDSLDASTFNLEANLWWPADGSKDFEKLGELPGPRKEPQVTTLNPHLNSSFAPTEPQAELFGAFAP